MVTSITAAVNCELSYAVTGVVARDLRDMGRRRYPVAYSDFLKDWGVQVAINLTATERTAVNPTALLTPPGTPNFLFKFASGLSTSSEAQRANKSNTFFFVSDLYRPDYFFELQPDGTRKMAGREKCLTPTGNRFGSPLVNSDLKLYTLLNARIASTALGIASFPGDAPLTQGDKNSLQSILWFKILTSTNATPSWTLVDATVNPSGPFLSTGRDNMQELVITFGPLDDSVKGRRALNPIAQTSHITTQIQTGIQSALNLYK